FTESNGLTSLKRAVDADGLPEASQRVSVGSRVLPLPPVVPSNGRAPGRGRHRRLPKVAQDVDHFPPWCRIRHPLRGRPAVHPDGCSSSCLSNRSIPSRMKDDVFPYLVYGTSSLIQSHVA